jgi:hypothetical protein
VEGACLSASTRRQLPAQLNSHVVENQEFRLCMHDGVNARECMCQPPTFKCVPMGLTRARERLSRHATVAARVLGVRALKRHRPLPAVEVPHADFVHGRAEVDTLHDCMNTALRERGSRTSCTVSRHDTFTHFNLISRCTRASEKERAANLGRSSSFTSLTEHHTRVSSNTRK